jgi:hypothetical protein
LGRTLAYDASGNIIIDGFGRVTYADAPLPSGGQSTSMTLGGSVGGERAGEHLHQPRWWGAVAGAAIGRAVLGVRRGRLAAG